MCFEFEYCKISNYGVCAFIETADGERTLEKNSVQVTRVAFSFTSYIIMSMFLVIFEGRANTQNCSQYR